MIPEGGGPAASLLLFNNRDQQEPCTLRVYITGRHMRLNEVREV